MKKAKQVILLFSLVLILFSSCQKSTPPQLAAIPNNASFVVALENKQIVQKGGLGKLSDFKCYEQFSKKLMKGNEEIVKFLKDPNATGLDMEQVYVFGVPSGDKMYIAASFKMKDEKIFETNISELIKKEGSDINPQIEDKKTFKMININQDSECVFVWNDKLFFLLLGDLENLQYEELFAMPAEKSITNLANFKEFQKHKYDIGFWMSYGALGDVHAKFIGTKMAMLEDMSGIYMHSYLEFKADEIKGTFIISPKGKVDEYYAKYPVWKDGFDPKLLADYPEKSYMAMKTSVNVLEYYKLIQKAFKELGNNPQMASVDDVLNNPMINTVCNALSGDMLFNIYGFAKGPFPIPLAGLTIGVKSEEDFQKLLALAPQQMIQKKGDYYVFSTGMMISVYIGYKDKKVFVTDDADAIATFVKKTSAKSLENTLLGKNMRDHSTVFYLNLDIDSYPENIQSLLKSDGLFDNMQSYVSFLSIFKNFTVVAKNKYEVESILKMKSGKENSLKQLLQKIDEFVTANSRQDEEEVLIEEGEVVMAEE